MQKKSTKSEMQNNINKIFFKSYEWQNTQNDTKANKQVLSSPSDISTREPLRFAV